MTRNTSTANTLCPRDLRASRGDRAALRSCDWLRISRIWPYWETVGAAGATSAGEADACDCADVRDGGGRYCWVVTARWEFAGRWGGAANRWGAGGRADCGANCWRAFQ